MAALGVLVIVGGFLAAVVILPGAGLAGFLGMRAPRSKSGRPLI